MNIKITYPVLFLLILILASGMYAGCEKSPSESDANLNIEEVLVSPELLLNGRTARFEVIAEALTNDMQLVWELEQSGGETIQKRTDSAVLFWEVSGASGIYNHTVHIENSKQEDISEIFPFSVQLKRIPDNAAVTGVQINSQPVTERQNISFKVVLDNRDPAYRYAWALQTTDGAKLDTVTQTDEFRWWAPNQHGVYKHRVTLVSEFGDTLSNTFDFEVMVQENPEPPERIVFVAKDENGTSQIHSMKPDGTDIIQLTDHPTGAYSPSWSPYGDYVVYSSFDGGTTAGPALWIMDYDGSNARFLLNIRNHLGLHGNNARWSPDGTKIVYRWSGHHGPANIYVFDFENSKYEQFTFQEGNDYSPKWNPNGYQFAFSSNRDHSGLERDIYIGNIKNKDVRRLTFTGEKDYNNHIWKNENELFLISFNRSSNSIEIIAKNIDTEEAEQLNIDLELYDYNFLHYETDQELFYLLNKDRDSSIVNVSIFDLNGNLIESFSMDHNILTNATGFDWHIPED